MLDFIAANAPFLTIMALIVLAIVVLGVGLEAFRVWARHRTDMAAAMAGEAAAQAARHAGRVEALEERMRVIERIVTDRGIALDDEIERLRGEPVPRALRSN